MAFRIAKNERDCGKRYNAISRHRKPKSSKVTKKMQPLLLKNRNWSLYDFRTHKLNYGPMITEISF